MLGEFQAGSGDWSHFSMRFSYRRRFAIHGSSERQETRKYALKTHKNILHTAVSTTTDNQHANRAQLELNSRPISLNTPDSIKIRP